MVNETTSKSANYGSKSRKERVDLARSRDILDVAEQLGMELERAGRDYRWKEHDSLVITPNKNVWKWFSSCLLYTSDAADDLLCVDLGGRRII